MAKMDIFDMSDTWNASGTTFTAIKMDVTDTASAAGSLLMDLRVGGTSRFSVRKDGRVDIAAPFVTTSGGYYLRDNTGIISLGSSDDVSLTRDAADTLAQRRGTNAQAFRVYNTFTDASNFERVQLYTLGTSGGVGWTHNGTGSARNFLVSGNQLVLQTGASYVNRWIIDTNGHFTAATDNTYDIGASNANRPRDVYVAARVFANNFSIASATGTHRAAMISPSDGIIGIYNAAQNDFGRLQFGGISASFPALKRSSTTLAVRLADDSADAPLTASTLVSTASPVNTTSIAALGYSLTGSDASSLFDVSGTWNTTGTPTLLKANVTDTASNAASLLLDLQVGGTSRLAVTKGGHIVQAGSYHEMAEMTAPAAPATNSVRIYAEDNGSGKTRLMARFATGAAVQIAIEP